LQFRWRTPVRLGRIILYDRPNTQDQVTSARAVFDSGFTVDVGELPDGAGHGLDVRFAEQETTSVTLFITGTKEGTGAAGFSEVALLPAE
jgi:hypothetical protein